MRPLATWSLLLPLVLAAGLGLALALDAPTTLLVCAVALVGAAMIARLELAVLLVVAGAVLGDYLELLDPRVTEALVVLLLGAWVVRRGWRRLHGGPPSRVLLAAGGFLVVLLVAFAVHPHGAVGWVVTLRWVGFLGVLGVLVDTMRGGLAPARVAAVYVGSCAVVAVLGITELALGADPRVGGLVGDPDDLAFLLLAALPLGVALRAGSRRTWVHDLTSCLLVTAVLGTFSRGALLGLAVAAAVAVLTRMVSWRALLVSAVSAVTLVALTAGVLADTVGSSLEQKSAVDDENLAERFERWQAASAMTLDAPAVGLGPGGFALYDQDYRRTPSQVTPRRDTAGNTYLEVSAELGVLGLLAWLVLLGTGLVLAWRRWRRDRDPLAAGVVTALVGTGVAALFHSEQHVLALWLLLALAAALGSPTSPTPSAWSSLRATRTPTS